MAYRDNQEGHDRRSTTDSLHMYDGQEPESKDASGHGSTTESTQDSTQSSVTGTQTRKPKPGILERARRALFGEKTLGDKARTASVLWRSEGGFARALSKMASPKGLTALVMGTSLGVFSILGLFTSYKNDDVIRNDPPIQCEEGTIELPPAAGEGSDNDIQETVNIMYDIFVNQFGYTEYDLVGMVACMLVETGCNPDRLESDYVPPLDAEKAAFDAAAGPGTNPDTATAMGAYDSYCALYASSGMHQNSGYLNAEGKVRCGIGLIQWTAGRADNFIKGLEKVSLDVSPMDVQYQCAYLIAEAMTSYPAWAPGGERTGNGDSATATLNFFGTMVYGHMPSAGDSHLADRLARVSEAEGYVFAASANSEFTMDAVTMAEELSEEGFNKTVSKAQGVQLCVNDTFIMTSDIASAAVSISFLERGDYEDVQGAYGSYRRAARSPNMINDWNYIEGKNQDVDTLGTPYNGDETYNSARGVTSQPKAGWKFYDIDGAPGKLDLIACTEYYYFAHLIAFPQETGVGGKAGYFSSCDRGTATAIRIAGADDKFPAGNPMYQLMWACGGAKQGAKHNENARGTQDAGFLWKFSGFMRGSDWYSASGSASLPTGGVMISWSVRAANGLLGENSGNATPGTSNSGGMLVPDDGNEEPDSDGGYATKTNNIKWATLRWPMSTANSTRHIITYVGDATVQKFWGIEWLQQQWTLFDDADRLIRKDLTEEVPEVMQKGLSFKSSFAHKSSDQHMTFYKGEARGAQDNDDLSAFKPANDRLYEFNEKTGLPAFHSWEQIYVRLIHDSDDDAAARTNTGGYNLYEKVKPYKEDGYLDDEETEDIDAYIEQYDGEDTYHNKYFFEDWNSLGPKGEGPSGAHEDDYAEPGASSLIWRDNTNGLDYDEPWTHERGAVNSPMWRYELVTDIEYRQNQFLRFGLASLMCSYPSEEDADTFQTGSEGNDTGHIMGNIYRRYSRIPDKVDTSGRYYYYNTVVSNDMLQDLVQLYNQERNAAANGTSYTGDKNDRNFGPMYLVGLRSVYSNDYMPTSQSANWLDRRYGLTGFDIDYIKGGIEGNKMGMADAKEISTAFKHILTEPMHLLSASQLALYDNTQSANAAAVNGAHESEHLYNSANEAIPYETEIYGMNPFLMLEGEYVLNINGAGSGGDDAINNDHDVSDSATSAAISGRETTAGKDDWEAGVKSGKSVRNSIDDKGVDGENIGKQDDRLSWIDRHYFVTKNGAVGTFSYQVLGLQPSVGTKIDTTIRSYDDWLKDKSKGPNHAHAETLNVGHEGQSNLECTTLYGSKGLVQYSDFIYAEDQTDNDEMAKRLFGEDDRNDDGKRDDYNRREFILIPYYHTHAQQDEHRELAENNYQHYGKDNSWCRWQDHKISPTVSDNLTTNTQAMIDTQVALNGQDGTNYRQDRSGTVNGVTCSGVTCSHTYDDAHDYGDTMSFNPKHVKNRGKYDVDQLLASIDAQDIRYFADTGDEIYWDDKPIIHVECDGWFEHGICWPSCHGTGCCEFGENCPNCQDWRCHACGALKKCTDYCYHPCDECLQKGYCHDHKECDDGGSIVHGIDHRTERCTCGISMVPSAAFSRAGGDTEYSHHNDSGGIDFAGQSDKCHYEYGCNALEYLYHNTDGADGPRKHYRNGTYGHTNATYGGDPVVSTTTGGPVFNTVGELYDVHNLYMAIPVAPGAKMSDFDITDYIRSGTVGVNDSVIPDKCNLLQQVTYDANGWVDNNWQTMIDAGEPGSLRYPDIDGSEYTGSVHCIPSSQATHDSAIKIGHPGMDEGDSYGVDVKGSPGQNDGLLQYFTIEGDSIHREKDWTGYLQKISDKYGTEESEYITHIEFNGTEDDLMALDPIRNKVGYGKTATQVIDVSGTSRTVDQGDGPGDNGSSSRDFGVQYESGYMSTEGADAADLGIDSHGWGEVAVTGTQHPKGPSDAATNYGNSAPASAGKFAGDPSVSGPDGSKGNNLLEFGPSLLREIIGDEHVVHVKFDTQDLEGLTDGDSIDNGRDFMFYVDKKQAALELGVEESELKPDMYQSDQSGYYQDHIGDFSPAGANAGSNKYGLFKSMDMDTLYLNFYTGEVTDKMYAERTYPHNATDRKRSEGANEDNMKNPPALAAVSEDDGAENGPDAMQKLVTFKEQSQEKGKDGKDNEYSTFQGDGTENTGDYRNWVTHASRGHRGMMTQYLNFANFFKDVYKAGTQDTNNAYMVFEVVNRTDIKTSEQGGTDTYGYPMGSDDADAAHDRIPTSKEESFVYKTPPSDAVRQLGVDATGNDPAVSWGYGDSAGFSDTYGQGGNSHWKNMIDLYNAAMSETRQYGY